MNPEDSFQKEIEKVVAQKFEQRVGIRSKSRQKSLPKGTNAFFRGIPGNTLSRGQEDLLELLQSEIAPSENGVVKVHAETFRTSFSLPAEFRDEAQTKPAPYRHVNTLQYHPTDRPPRIASECGKCECIGVCGDSCMNRMLYTECFGDIEAGKGNKNTNCAVGVKCGNRQFGQKLFATCKPKREQGRGWGLVLMSKVYDGDLVIEYVGEVIDEKTKDTRLQEWTDEHPNDPNFYIMELQPGWFIDARNVANLARFINHSCDPNCRLTQINCNGRMRCGIFALRDIEPGEFLSYDYHFDTRHGDKFVCCCGSANCRGTMKGGLNDSPCSLTRDQAWEAAKAEFDRDRTLLDEFFEAKSSAVSLVSELVPAADIGSKDELVANGPQTKFRESSRRLSLFLWRNATRGADFVERINRLENEGSLKSSK